MAYKTYGWYFSDQSPFIPHLRIVDKTGIEGGMWMDSRTNRWSCGPTFCRFIKDGDDYE